MSFSFWDGIVSTPEEEVALCLQRVHSSHHGDATSLEGRAWCLLRVGTHAAGIGVKPLMYSGYWATQKATLALLPSLFDSTDPSFRQFSRENPDEAKVIAALLQSNELLERNVALVDGVLWCALVSPITQTVQVLKAAGGLFHPGAYFKNDPFVPIFAILESVAREVGCSQELVDAFHDGANLIKVKLYLLPNRDYYLAAFHRDLAEISETMRGPELPPERKLFLLSMLDPLSSDSGMKGCAPALGRILESIVAHLNVPSDPREALAHLASQAKHEVISRMVMATERALNAGEPMSDWQTIVHESAHDPAHRGNALVLVLGDRIGLSQKTMTHARHDKFAVRSKPLTQPEKTALERSFFDHCTKEDLLQSLLFQVNSQPDGSAGLSELRAAIFRCLCEDLDSRSGGEDTSLEAVRLYYKNEGQGSPTDPAFTDLSACAISTFARLAVPVTNPMAAAHSREETGAGAAASLIGVWE